MLHQRGGFKSYFAMVKRVGAGPTSINRSTLSEVKKRCCVSIQRTGDAN